MNSDLYRNSTTDYVKDGAFVLGEGEHDGVLVESEDDLEVLPEGLYQPGALAHTAGWKKAWEMAPDGHWEPMIGGDSSEVAEE